MNTKQLKKQLILNIPYIILGLAATNLGEAWRLAAGANASKKIQSLVLDEGAPNGIFKSFAEPESYRSSDRHYMWSGSENRSISEREKCEEVPAQ